MVVVGDAVEVAVEVDHETKPKEASHGAPIIPMCQLLIKLDPLDRCYTVEICRQSKNNINISITQHVEPCAVNQKLTLVVRSNRLQR